MHVLIAFDKFKDALTGGAAGEAVAGALREKHPNWTLDLCPLTDGGEEFCEILTRTSGGELRATTAAGPHGARAAGGGSAVKTWTVAWLTPHWPSTASTPRATAGRFAPSEATTLSSACTPCVRPAA